MSVRKALAIWAGCALIAVYVVLRAWDHFRGRPIEPDPWAVLPQPDLAPIRLADMRTVWWSDNLTETSAGPTLVNWRRDTSRWN